jgi:hypothetical protein
MANDAERPTFDGAAVLGLQSLANTTPRPWRTGSTSLRCVKTHAHTGRGDCDYTPQCWNDEPDYFGRFVSAVDGTEIIGSDDNGPVLSLDDARLIVAAVNAFAPFNVGRADGDAGPGSPHGASLP